MKPHILLLPLGLSLFACSPSGNTVMSSSDSDSAVAVESPAAVAEPAAEDSVSSSAASVVVQTTEIYDAPTIDKVAAKPGYWQIAHVDPDTHKRYVTKVCIDRDLGRRLAADRPQPPAGWRGGTPDASFLGACPSNVHGGDVVDRSGHQSNAWGGHRDDHGRPPVTGPVNPGNPGSDHHDDGHHDNGEHDGSHSSSSSADWRDRDHQPPGDGGAPGRPDNHMGQGASSSSHDHRSH